MAARGKMVERQEFKEIYQQTKDSKMNVVKQYLKEEQGVES